MATTAILVSIWFAVAPPVSNPDPRVADLDAALEVFGNAETVSAEATRVLAAAISEIERHPELTAGDLNVQARLSEARLSLASGYLTNGDGSAAVAAMDEAIRSARGRTLATETFGPDVIGLYNDRMAALEQAGRATIEVDCGAIPCEVIINEWSATPTSTAPLLLGHYRVWVGPQEHDEGEVAWEFHDVVLSEAGGIMQIVFGAGLVPPPTLSTPPANAPAPDRRLQPSGRQAYIIALKREKARDDINRGAILAGVSAPFLVASGLSIFGLKTALVPEFWIGSSIVHGVIGLGLLIGGLSVLSMGLEQRKRLRVAAMPTGRLTPMMFSRGAGLGFTLRM